VSSPAGPLRVLRVIARMNVGGPALQVVNLTRNLDGARFEQRLLIGNVGPDEADFLELRAPDISPRRIEGLGRSVRPLDDVRALAAIRREIRAFRPDIVHTHTAKAGVLGRVAAVTSRVPAVVHTFHGHLLHGYFSPPVTTAVVTAERALARVTTRLVAVGSQVRDELLAAGIGRPEQFCVVPPGVGLPTPPEAGDARKTLGLPAGAPVVAFVARLTAIKRPDRFLAAAEVIARSRPDALFVVAGEGSELAALQAGARHLGDRFRFLGWRPDVETVYAAADVIMLTSDNEGMPVSLIEAASVGCPAVTTRVGSAAEVVVDGVTGFVTDHRPEALAAAAAQILDDPSLRARLSAAAATHARTCFGPERLVADMEHLYEELAVTRSLV
jgi:glycosyltransferase involved in cell wall biosynthesis